MYLCMYKINDYSLFLPVSYITRLSTSNLCNIVEQIDWEDVTQDLTDRTHDTYITLLPDTMVTLIVGVRHRNKTLMHVRTSFSDLTCHPRQVVASGLANCTVANNVTSCEQHNPCIMFGEDDERGFDDNIWEIVTCYFRCFCAVECGFFVLRVSTEKSQTSRIHELSGMWSHVLTGSCHPVGYHSTFGTGIRLSCAGWWNLPALDTGTDSVHGAKNRTYWISQPFHSIINTILTDCLVLLIVYSRFIDSMTPIWETMLSTNNICT